LGKGEEEVVSPKRKGGREVGFLSHPFPYSVKSPIIKHVSITKHFLIFFLILSSNLNFLLFFKYFILFNLFILCHWTYKLEGYKWFLNVKRKEAMLKTQEKHKKRMSDSLLQFFWKISFRLLSSSSPLSFSFFIFFEWFKSWWVCQLGYYKISWAILLSNFCISKAKMQRSKILSSKS
jgi:hypothetical protein